MKKLYLKNRGRLVRLNDNVAGTIVGFSNSHLILLLEEGTEVDYSFSLDDIGDENPFVDFSLTEHCEVCLLCWVDESQLNKKK